MDKRTFIKTSSLIGLGSLLSFPALARLMESVSHIPSGELAMNEDFWLNIREGYQLKTEYINLENGYYCIQPREVLESFISHVREINMEGAYYMRTVQEDNKKKMSAMLAEVAGCSPDELIITRNTTESLDMIISGFHWNAGDEAVMAEQDYGAMLDMFAQVSKRYGMVNKIITIQINPKSDDEIVELYSRAITPKTKLLMVSHMINITGHILPVRKICDMAHARGVQVMVDGAHAFAHIKFKISDLNCDYYGTSLHKWMSVPLGAGFLYVKKEHIPAIWPLFAEGEHKDDDITRLNHTGTTPVHTDLAIANAISYYNTIGAQRKEDRLRYLQNYWTGQVRGVPNIILNTPEDISRSCAIANVGIKNMKPSDMAESLLKKHGIYTVAIDGRGVHGCRITPNVYTTTAELDALVKALKEMAV
jgi:selenocysteine lyase/cysteine desulfurase